MSEIPQEARAAYALGGQSPTPVHSLINRTYLAARQDGSCVIVQRLHPTFLPEVNLDIDAVTRHLARAGFDTPRLVHTVEGLAWVRDGEGQIWRALTYVPGRVIHAIERPEQAATAAALVARFHRAMVNLHYGFRSVRTGAHDTGRHLAKLQEVAREAERGGDTPVLELCNEILSHARKVRIDFSTLPSRIGHGDLKISNILFWEQHPDQARCLIDLDTLGQLPVAHELGDALRSWCNLGGENQPSPSVNLEIFQAALRGYAHAAAGFLQPPEVDSIVDGLETISLELAARFAADALEDCYFGWDEQRFASRREHNLVRAQGQLALSTAVSERRDELLRIAHDAFAAP